MNEQQRKAIELSLEALERYQVKRQDFERFSDVITALKEALAQPEQEPIGYLGLDDVENLVEYPHRCRNLNIWCEGGEGFAPLYTTPPQRIWVGLTNEEIEFMPASHRVVTRWAEDKLKDKNK